jgi:hypothetical protein
MNSQRQPQQCSCCGKMVSAKTYRQKHGLRYCSILCEDIGEEKNQGDDYAHLEFEPTERTEDYQW